MEFIEKYGRKFPVVRRDNPTDPIHCPYCGRQHHHGTGDGHRISHCGTFTQKHPAVLDDGTDVYSDTGYWIITNKKEGHP